MTELIDDRGNSTVLSSGIIAALSAIFLVLANASSRQIDSHRAQVAADLSAVAAAHALHRGEDPCAIASQVAALNGASISDCRVSGQDVTVYAQRKEAIRPAKAGPI